MSASVPPASNNIFESIEKLRHLSRVEVQSGWRYSDADSAVSEVNICNWQIAELNQKGHIAWAAGKQVLQLGQLFVVPHNLQGYPVTGMRLLLSLSWWAEDARIFVNGEIVGRGDLFDCADRVLLSSSANPGDEFLVILRLVSPGHDCGALVRSTCLYEAADSDCFDPGFVGDELEILQNSLTRNWEVLNLPHSSTEIVADRAILVQRETLQSEISRQVSSIDWSALPDRAKFDRSLSILRQNLLGYLRNFPGDLKDGTAEGAENAERKEKHRVFAIGEGGEKFSTSIYIGEGGEKLSKFRGLKPLPKNLTVNCQLSTVNCLKTSIYIGEIYLLGHAHLDLAWLWPIEETWSAAERTFESVLKLQVEFPDLIFCHSTPALYAWIEEQRPDLFAAIKKQVIAGRWEVVGGMWVEPDLNLISGESMVRQVIYGQRYAEEKFGELMRVAWLPDTFGFGWQLPQILRQGGVEYFVTQKLRWNDTTEFPYGVFWWEGLDGTKIFSMMSGPIGESTESVKMANHAVDWQMKTGLQAAFWLPGVGDHGGGPTRDMLAVAKRWEKSPFFPKLQFGKAVDYLSAIESQFSPEVSQAESEDKASSRENQQILAVGEVVENQDAIESANFGKISDFESQSNVSSRENQQILGINEVVGNLSEIASANFVLISNSKSQDEVSTQKNQQILAVGEVGENQDAIESPNFAEISEFESQADVSIRENQQSLAVGEVVENLDAIESPNFAEISEFESQADVSIRENQQSLAVGEVVENLDAIESPNFAEISEFESQADVSIRENQQSLAVGEVVGNQDAIESPNFTEISESESEDKASIRENQQILAVGEVVGNQDAIESANFMKISESESQADASTRENQQILAVDEAVENKDAIESANFEQISGFESQDEASTRKNQQILAVGEVVENFDAIESPNFEKISGFESENKASTRKNQQILAVGEAVENKDAIESANFEQISGFESENKASTRKNQQILAVGEAVENKDAIESANFEQISGFESQDEASTRKNQQILAVGEVVENFDAIESRQNQENLKVAENLPLSPSPLPPLPIWKDELYLEFHRGCYTTRADQKRQNRRCEELLYQAELLSSIATICTGAVYPKSELETAWKQVLFNQFHDILPGSSIAQVYVDANLAFVEVDRTCREIMAKSLQAIAAQISLPSPPQPDAQPIFIFNTLNWSRSEVVAVPIPDSAAENWQIYDLSGQRLATQISGVDRPESQFTLLFSANNLPAVGYRVFWLCRAEAETFENALPAAHDLLQTDLAQVTSNVPPKLAVCQETHFETERKVLENQFILATIDGETGDLSSIWDKVNNREVLNAVGGDRLQAFQDGGQYWDAWNIDPNYQKYQLPPPLLKDISWVEQGEVRQSLRVTRQIGKSVFCQDYIVDIGSPLLKIKTVVDWQETHVLIKTAFGLNQSADFVTCEIPCGAIDRPTKPQTAAEKAKWEVPILRWADISNDGFGVSLLNDCKYGCDFQSNQLRLTLLRGSTWPDERADLGIHEFTYAVYPHSGNWQNAGTVRRGYELNLPPLVQVFSQLRENCHKTLPTVGKFLDLSADNLVLMAFKQSEDNANLWILRCYESEGKDAVLELNGDLGLAIVRPVDLLEQRANSPQKSDDGRSFKILPWKIASFTVNRSEIT